MPGQTLCGSFALQLVKLLIASFPWHSTVWFYESQFSKKRLPGKFSKSCVQSWCIFRCRILPSISGGNWGQYQQLILFEVSLGLPWSATWKKFSMNDIRFLLLTSLWLLEDVLAPRKLHYNMCGCISTHSYLYVYF